MSLFGRDKLPAAAADAVFAQSPLLPGERILQWVPADAGWVVATSVGLRWQAAYELVRWDEISHVSYAAGTMTVQPAGVKLRFDEIKRLPEVVRDRVNASIAIDRHMRLAPDGRGMRVVGRRRSDTGELRWDTTYDTGVDQVDPLIEQRAAAALDEVRSLFS